MALVLLTHVMGAFFGLLAVIFGVFGAHALKKSFSKDQLKSFETGVKYQMYHAILLLVLGFNLISLGLIPRGLPRFLEESLKTDGFHQIKNYLPLNASWACPEDFFTLETSLEKYMVYCFILGAFLFSFSIYGLAP